jgi:hypothetical protein
MTSFHGGASGARAELYHDALHSLRGEQWRQWQRAYLAGAPLARLEALLKGQRPG